MKSGARVHEFVHGERVLLVPKGFPDLARPANLESIARENRIHLIWIQDPPELFRERWSRDRLEREHATNPQLAGLYADIADVQRRRKVRAVLIMGDGGYWHPDFVARLRGVSPVWFWTADDPEGSELTSRPYVRHYDHVFCGGIYFAAGVRISEQFTAWGAPRVTFVPLGACVDKYRLQGDRSDEQFFRNQRDIDIVYVGTAVRHKIVRILQLKRHYGNRLFLGGRRWDGRGMGLKGMIVRVLRRLGGIGEVREVSHDELIDIYQRTKIGFNCHLSYGPSNSRMYELPLNGVMQVCDCADGFSELYRVGEEALAYDTMADAYRQIEWALNHEDERVRIARSGYYRALGEYQTEHSFAKLFSATGF